MSDNLLSRAMQMRNAIDALESAMMGLGDFIELPGLFEAWGDEIKVAPSMTMGQVRQVCTALEDCTRIINSDYFTPQYLKSIAVTTANDGIPNRMGRVEVQGNAVVPQIPEIIGRAIMNVFSSGEGGKPDG